eukprot:TRINITY_DN70452_c0_g1_i1.p1 TRINITY_DN70452_c0_g1~~TRINITY_DN70452_c0_g1_i1.p1  ORF type:complete len:503 (+),score=49.37 TRINITY_DN70452_c0_g1_i1:73-1509(+)
MAGSGQSITSPGEQPGICHNANDARTEGGSRGDGPTSMPPTASAKDAKRSTNEEMGVCLYGIYYMLLFFAFWFGSDAFDWDQDGDFDVEDARLIISEKMRQVRQCFRKKATTDTRTNTSSESSLQTQSGESIEEADGLAAARLDAVGEDTVEGTVEDTVEGHMVENIKKGKVRPIFTTCQCLVCLLLWVVLAARDVATGKTDMPFNSAMGGVESLFRGGTAMTTYTDCEDQRAQVWRMLSYQFTHVGLSHVITNCFLTILLGLPLEMLHGTLRMFLMFNVGVFGGACCCLVSSTHTIVVGMSGGCYALLGMHLADLVINWKQTRFRWPTLGLLVMCFWIDLLVSLDVLSTSSSATSSHSAHFGGYVAGTCVGIVFGTNLKVTRWERILQGVIVVVGALLVVGCFLWSSLQWPPRDIWTPQSYCWLRQVYNASFYTANWACIRCGDQQCVAGWTQQEYIKTVGIKDCLTSNRWLDPSRY